MMLNLGLALHVVPAPIICFFWFLAPTVREREGAQGIVVRDLGSIEARLGSPWILCWS